MVTLEENMYSNNEGKQPARRSLLRWSPGVHFPGHQREGLRFPGVVPTQSTPPSSALMSIISHSLPAPAPSANIYTVLIAKSDSSPTQSAPSTDSESRWHRVQVPPLALQPSRDSLTRPRRQSWRPEGFKPGTHSAQALWHTRLCPSPQSKNLAEYQRVWGTF